ncbi:MAG: L,D-transpeptidase [Verrucomicrobiota bacterium]
MWPRVSEGIMSGLMRKCVLAAVLSATSIFAKGKDSPALRILLDESSPGKSVAILTADPAKSISVGFGKKGVLDEGQSFRGNYSLLGTFRINAILSPTRFEMTEELVADSGRSRDWLKENLFANMSSIDFDGDGRGGEYGDGFVGLEPVGSTSEQPFHFGEYRGVFRWYSYAIHGTQDEARVGKMITGGCLNVRKKDLRLLLESLKVGDFVRVELFREQE